MWGLGLLARHQPSAPDWPRLVFLSSYPLIMWVIVPERSAKLCRIWQLPHRSLHSACLTHCPLTPEGSVNMPANLRLAGCACRGRDKGRWDCFENMQWLRTQRAPVKGAVHAWSNYTCACTGIVLGQA